MATLQCMCKNCGSLISFDDSAETCECIFCHSVFPREEAINLLENTLNNDIENEIFEGRRDTFQAENTSWNSKEYHDDPRILEEHEVVEQKENVVAGIVGALIFSLAGGVLWFVLFQFGWFSAISGVVGVVCANIGYRLFARGESLKGVIISIIAAVVSIILAWYMCLSLDCYNAFQDWYANGEIDYKITFAQAVRGSYAFLAEPEIARPYFTDLAIGLVLCAVGAFRFVANSIKRYK